MADAELRKVPDQRPSVGESEAAMELKPQSRTGRSHEVFRSASGWSRARTSEQSSNVPAAPA